mmetsp:Transcript_65058/g.172296  ORF Transcript_65058/g.172296 Transcript_65058/m.172296 type:complete len:382 (-) Transcript_65058:307-1452(-)
MSHLNSSESVLARGRTPKRVSISEPLSVCLRTVGTPKHVSSSCPVHVLDDYCTHAVYAQPTCGSGAHLREDCLIAFEDEDTTTTAVQENDTNLVNISFTSFDKQSAGTSPLPAKPTLVGWPKVQCRREFPRETLSLSEQFRTADPSKFRANMEFPSVSEDGPLTAQVDRVSSVAKNKKDDEAPCSFSLPVCKWQIDAVRSSSPSRIHGAETSSTTGPSLPHSRVNTVQLDADNDKTVAVAGTFGSDQMTIEILNARLAQRHWGEVTTSSQDLVVQRGTLNDTGVDAGHGHELEEFQEPPRSLKLGSVEIPTIGSLNHHRGACKPCGFVYKNEGCHRGVDCLFCHLCIQGERQRRTRVRRAALRLSRRQRDGVSITIMQVPT